MTVRNNDAEAFHVLHYWLGAGHHLIREMGFLVYERSDSIPPPNATTPLDSSISPPVPDHSAPTVKLTEDQARAIVLIKGDNADMDAIQNPQNFYFFDEQRAKNSIAYRKALINELSAIGNDVSRLTSLPRTNR